MANWRVEFTSKALDFLNSMPEKLRQKAHVLALDLRRNPTPPDSKILVGLITNGLPVHRIKCGQHYRILYIIQPDGEILVTKVDHRKDVYR